MSKNLLATIACIPLSLVPGCATAPGQDMIAEEDLPALNGSLDSPDATHHAEAEQAFPGRQGLAQILSTDQGEVHYQLIDGMRVLDGDIILADSHMSEGTGRRLARHRWPDNTVPYVVDLNFNGNYRIREAIDHWEASTDLRFVHRTTEPDYVRFFNNGGGGCSSSVGRIGGEQLIRIAGTCTTGNTIHEIGHAIGLWHEQSRLDRDTNVTVHWDNIPDGLEDNFQTYLERGNDGFDHGAYDIQSMMHYGSYAFSSNGAPTITRLDGSTFTANRTALTAGDIAAVHAMYESIRGSRTYGPFTAYRILPHSSAPVGIYTMHANGPTSSTVELRRDGAPVMQVFYDWTATISATQPYTVNFPGYFELKIGKAGSGTRNLHGLNEWIFDGFRYVDLHPKRIEEQKTYHSYRIADINFDSAAPVGRYTLRPAPGNATTWYAQLYRNGTLVSQVPYWVSSPVNTHVFSFPGYMSIQVASASGVPQTLSDLGASIFDGRHYVEVLAPRVLAQSVHGIYRVHSIGQHLDAPIGVYTVATPVLGRADLYRNGVLVSSLTYTWQTVISAQSPHTFNFPGFFSVTVGINGTGTANLYYMNTTVFDGQKRFVIE